MEFQDILDSLTRIPRAYYIPIVLAVFGLVLIGYGLIEGSQKQISPASGNISQTIPTVAQTFIVDVEGAVIHPGIYKLTSSARIQDSLVAAGGLASAADREWVAKNLNLAQRLTDGAKIYIPQMGSQPTGSQAQAGVAGASTNMSSGININTASATDLDSLPGVGPVTAQKIIQGRPYGSVQELLDKKIVSSKVFEEIKDKISIY